ncbi:type 1 fimbrial protein [Serratia sp. SRS-8-S-2018]|uniref:fimbrial protein n=1 Tax=Serratia TaxID=613 RepID=UPI00097659D4|nr:MULTISPECIES: fimbrial protein [Serratia]EIT7185230.1 type 1 fimbrial protein [Serratia marcescens]EJC6394310.1 type 1 fimbrial protein [Serratia marcescens]OMP53440.1 hypothetical protein BES32_15210 [Serratia marcescens]RZF16402.1 hypothetical protein B7L62_10575 [Serratia marcescens]TPW52155.1 type 1 fimbrial protein [Serratia sp. SRS-8-S-2018]
MMRKIALPLTLLGAAMLAPPLQAADGNINITGRVTESSCVLDARTTRKIDFGTRLVKSTNVQIYGGFYIYLADCPDSIKQVKVRFEGTPAESKTKPGKVFAIDNINEPGAAKNVGFTFYDIYREGVPDYALGVNEISPLIDLKEGEVNRFSFGYGYTTDGLMPTAGIARSRVQFSLIYP